MRSDIGTCSSFNASWIALPSWTTTTGSPSSTRSARGKRNEIHVNKLTQVANVASTRIAPVTE